MFERVIIAAEFGRAGEEIYRCLKSLKPFGIRQCLLVQTVGPPVIDPRLSPLDPDQPPMVIMPPDLPDMADERLNGEKERLQELGLHVETRTVQLDLAHELTRMAREEKSDLILVAEAEHTLLGQMLFGGVAHSVIHRAPCPVLQVRVPEEDESSGDELPEKDITNRILFPTDFSKNALLAFEQVREMVRMGVKNVILAHVQDSARISPHLIDQLETFNKEDLLRLEALQGELQKNADVSVEIQLRYGTPATELLQLIEDEDISLVIMGSQGRGFIREISLGSVSQKIARHASSSVLLVPAQHTG